MDDLIFYCTLMIINAIFVVGMEGKWFKLGALALLVSSVVMAVSALPGK
jgi:hypothetical protein